MRRSPAIVGLALLTGAALLQPAAASAITPKSASISSSGVKSVSVFTHRDSADGWITFKVTDRQRDGANVSQCDIDSDGDRVNCDSYKLRPADYRGGQWKVRRTSTGWEIRIYIGYYSATNSECWSLQSGARVGVQIGILSERERLLDSHSHTYMLRCDGVAAKANAPKTLIAREGQNSLKFTVNATVLDRQHAVKNVRRCFYDVEADEPMNCFNDPVTKVAKRTAAGWTMARDVTYNDASARECRYFARENPRREYRITFRNGGGDVLGSTTVSYRMDCRG